MSSLRDVHTSEKVAPLTYFRKKEYQMILVGKDVTFSAKDLLLKTKELEE